MEGLQRAPAAKELSCIGEEQKGRRDGPAVFSPMLPPVGGRVQVLSGKPQDGKWIGFLQLKFSSFRGAPGPSPVLSGRLGEAWRSLWMASSPLPYPTSTLSGE